MRHLGSGPSVEGARPGFRFGQCATPTTTFGSSYGKTSYFSIGWTSAVGRRGGVASTSLPSQSGGFLVGTMHCRKSVPLQHGRQANRTLASLELPTTIPLFVSEIFTAVQGLSRAESVMSSVATRRLADTRIDGPCRRAPEAASPAAAGPIMCPDMQVRQQQDGSQQPPDWFRGVAGASRALPASSPR